MSPSIKRINAIGRIIMARHHPITWTAVHLALASAATWLLLETEALPGALLVFFH
ncbi:hypothetical protein [Massilia sp. KIM]|uniref:hypothetical protein n=1 Tax=Massilia sp. KIM TaxID=1955422 RepID=UPI0015C3F982|nr:hypothetical protein [Massilia sp. KIM]